MNQAFIKAAMAIGELAISLENISADDKKQISDYTQAEVVKEAKYVLGKFTGESGGYEQEEELNGDHGIEQQRWAQKEVRKLKSFIKKYQ